MRAIWNWIDQRTGISDTLIPILTHLVPRDARWWYVFGSAALCAFSIQLITGACLAMAYVPSGGDAYESLRYITEEAPLGRVLRGMHSYGASAMIVMVVIHLTQVYLHASFKYPREVNWMSGVVLMFVVLGMAFTGQLLRWDANGVWSVVVGAEQAGRVPVLGRYIARFILGGDTVGGATLSRFYVMHVFILPGLIMAGIALHLWLVLRHGISEMPKAGSPVVPETYKADYETRIHKTGVPFWPDAAWRDAVFSTLMVALIVGCAVVFGPPATGNPPDPSNINANPKPDWYFWWYFAVLSMLPASMESLVIVGAPAVGFLTLFCVPLWSNRGERAPSKRPWAVGIVIAAALALCVLTLYGMREPWSPDFDVKPLSEAVVNSEQPTVVHGAELVHKKGCLYCHNIDGAGGRRGPELSQIGQLLDRGQLIIRINNGGYNMPAFASSLTSAELSDIVDFLQTRRGTEPLKSGRSLTNTTK